MSLEQDKALTRISDYPLRIQRLKRLWIDLHVQETPAFTEGGARSRSNSRLASGSRNRASPQLVGAGASVLGAKPGRRSQSGHRHTSAVTGSSRVASSIAGGHGQGPLTAAQIRDLMSRDLTPEDYELLSLLDDGIKKARTLSSGAASKLPCADGMALSGKECSICLCALESDEDVRLLPSCGHMYHASCIEHWLTASKANCPLCGAEVEDTF